MKTKILIVEHDPTDIELINRELKKAGISYSSEVVHTSTDFQNALVNFVPDLILCDYTFPSFDGPTAFAQRQKTAPNTPFIFVSGTVGEETSVELIRNGVTDYSLKDRLFTLGTKVMRALKESRERKAKALSDHNLLESERRLAKGQEVAHMGSWELDFISKILTWSDEACRIYGIPLSQNQQTLETWFSFIHPDDAPLVYKKIKDSFVTLKSSNFNFRFIHKDGSTRNGYTEWECEYGKNKIPLRLYGIIKDTTELKKTEAALRLTNDRLAFHIENSPLGFIEWDTQLHIKSWSKRAEEIFGWTEKELIASGKTGYNHVYNEDRPHVFKMSQELVAGEVPSTRIEHRNYTKKGEVIWCEWFNAAIKDESGAITSIRSLVQDITSRKLTEDKLTATETAVPGTPS